MKNYIYLIFLISITLNSQIDLAEKEEIKQDLNEIITDIKNYYIYIEEKNIDISCIEERYKKKIDKIETENDKLLFFEYLLDEFYDSHLILNSNTQSSFRLYSCLYIKTQDRVSIIENVWQTQIFGLNDNIIGAKILKFNGLDFQEVVDAFPTECQDKSDSEIRNWIANKVIAGRYNGPRILTLKLLNEEIIELDLDKIVQKEETGLLQTKVVNDIGVIRFNNSLGESDLIEAFDEVLDSLFEKKGLILDLRNTVDGGDSYIARAILGRFIESNKPYQKHWTIEAYGNHPPIERS